MTRSSRRRRMAGMAVFVGLLAIVLAACAPENLPYNTLDPAGPVAEKQAELFMLVFWIAVAVFVLVEGALVYIMWKYRRRSADDTPTQLHGNTRLEVIWTIIPALLLAGIAVPTVGTIFDLAQKPAGALEVRITGHQWWWEIEYESLGVVTANELHIPTGEQVVVNLTSDDVIHAWWVPRLAGKQDLIPGRTNSLNVAADQPGTYLGTCAEFCGLSHANMRFRVVAEEPAAFETWVETQRSQAAPPIEGSSEAEGQVAFGNLGCIACHAIGGVNDPPEGAPPAPNLTHVGARQTIAGGTIPNTPEGLERWLTNPPAAKPGSMMPVYPMTDEQMQDLIAYLQSLR